ncbi:hypothetical protein SAMN02910384_00908 [Pseudobutyrivibrio sp. ACV-2]|uniref:hypothetical protein n=1 Tax=Pseudobutyrivibrio sp. ACV-2 TaxID=1520801 RepID=UPI00089B16EF|nr:hypothetical protein [Pseudobutyrivibrio sp. ACV-2]SEA11769.1 hypothetical protein SAMN02910384_00908 [Pseudobutyrivibrio sp. ACV-2]
MERKKRENRTIINIGTALMVVILIGMAFAVIAALSISSSHHDYELTKKMAERTQDYYAASNQAYEKIAESNWKNQEFTVDINENQVLSVKVSDGEIETWQVENTGDWDAQSSQPVLILEE